MSHQFSRQFLSSSSSTVSLRSSTTASTSALVVPLPTLSLRALAATSDGTPQLRRMCDGLEDAPCTLNYVTADNAVAGIKKWQVNTVTCFHCLSGRRRRRWPAASRSRTIPSSLERERRINHSEPFAVHKQTRVGHVLPLTNSGVGSVETSPSGRDKTDTGKRGRSHLVTSGRGWTRYMCSGGRGCPGSGC